MGVHYWWNTWAHVDKSQIARTLSLSLAGTLPYAGKYFIGVNLSDVPMYGTRVQKPIQGSNSLVRPALKPVLLRMDSRQDGRAAGPVFEITVDADNVLLI